MSTIKMKAGTKITCPGCSEHIATAIADIYPGIIDSSKFEFVKSKREDGHMKCPSCDERYGKVESNTGNGWIHTEDGWLR